MPTVDDQIRNLTAHLGPGNDDAAQWAAAFVRVVALKPEIATDEGAMISWVAKALDAGVPARELASLSRRLVELALVCQRDRVSPSPAG